MTTQYLYKKYYREEKKIESQNRGEKLTNTLYKGVATLIDKRLEEETEMKAILLNIQAGFRRGRSYTVNMYVLNYVAAKKIMQEGRKIYSVFL